VVQHRFQLWAFVNMVKDLRIFCPVAVLMFLKQLVLFVNYNLYAKVFINVGHTSKLQSRHSNHYTVRSEHANLIS
jgi:hypothetical protein